MPLEIARVIETLNVHEIRARQLVRQYHAIRRGRPFRSVNLLK